MPTAGFDNKVFKILTDQAAISSVESSSEFAKVNCDGMLRELSNVGLRKMT
jgi:hypothetical protein